MHWQQSMWPGWTSKFFLLSCCVILRVILFYPCVFRLWIFNILQNLVACCSKTLPSTCSWCKQIAIFLPWCYSTDLSATNKQFRCLHRSQQVPLTCKIWCKGVCDMMSSTIFRVCTCFFSVPLYFSSERKRDS